MRNANYILDCEGNPVPCINISAWARWFEGSSDQRRLAYDDVVDSDGELVSVSTVFLGMDHNFVDDGPPILWETMIFGLGDDQEYQERYTSKEAALEGHQKAIQYVRGEL